MLFILLRQDCLFLKIITCRPFLDKTNKIVFLWIIQEAYAVFIILKI